MSYMYSPELGDTHDKRKCCVLTLQDGRSPLYTASFNGKVEVVKVLLAHGAKVDLPSDVRYYVCSNMFFKPSHTCNIIITV